MVAKRAFFVGVLVVTASILGACDSGPEPMVTVTPTPVPGSPTASPSPTPAPAAPASAPVMPELAKQNTSEGAAAFVTYWFEAVNWAWASNDATGLRQLSAKECAYCSRVLDGLERRSSLNLVRSGGGATVSDIKPRLPFQEDRIVLDLVYSERSGRSTLPDGTIYQEWSAVEPSTRQVILAWDEDGWMMGGFGKMNE